MKKIRNAFEDKKAFIAYLTAGDPDLDTTKELVRAMEKAGVDIVEIAIPYGKTVEKLSDLLDSNKRAIANGVKADDVFNLVEDLKKEVRIHLIILAYLETIENYGISRFMRRCKECNISGLVVPNLPCNEKTQISKDSELFGVELISVVNSGSREQVASIAKHAKGFVYCESSLDEVGKEPKMDLRDMVAIVRANAKVPCAMGFGINTPDQAKELARISDGVVIGNGIVKTIAQYEKDCVKPVTEYVKSIKAAIRQA